MQVETHPVASPARVMYIFAVPVALFAWSWVFAFLAINTPAGSDTVSRLVSRVLDGEIEYTFLEVGSNLSEVALYDVRVRDPNGRQVIEVRSLRCSVAPRLLVLGRLEFPACSGGEGRMLVEPYEPQGEVGFITAFSGPFSSKILNDPNALLLSFPQIELTEIDVLVNLDDMLLRFDGVTIREGRLSNRGADLRIAASATTRGGRLLFRNSMFTIGDGKGNWEDVAWDIQRRQRPWTGAYAAVPLDPQGRSGWTEIPLASLEITGFEWRDDAFRIETALARGPMVDISLSGWTRLVSEWPKWPPARSGVVWFDGRASLSIPPSSPLFDHFLPGVVRAGDTGVSAISPIVFDGYGSVQFFDGVGTRLQAQHLSVLGWELRDADLGIDLDGPRVTLLPDSSMEIWGGRVTGGGVLDTVEGRWYLDLCADGVRLDDLLEPLGVLVEPAIASFARARMSTVPARCNAMPTATAGMHLFGDLTSRSFTWRPAATTPAGTPVEPPMLGMRADGLLLVWDGAPMGLPLRRAVVDVDTTLTQRGEVVFGGTTPGLRLVADTVRAEVRGVLDTFAWRWRDLELRASTTDANRWTTAIGGVSLPHDIRFQGTVQFDGDVGAPSVPVVRATLERPFSDEAWPDFRFELAGGVDGNDLRVDRLALSSSVAEAVASGRMALFGATVFDLVANPNLNITLDLQRLRLGAVVAGLGTSAELQASGVRVTGRPVSPRLTAESLTVRDLELGEEPIDMLEVEGLSLDNDGITIAHMRAARGTGTLDGTLTWVRRTGVLNATLRGRRILLRELRTLALADIDLQGAADFDLMLRGTLEEPDVDGRLSIDGLSYGTMPLGGLGLAIDTYEDAIHATGGLGGVFGLSLAMPLDRSPWKLTATFDRLSLTDHFPALRDVLQAGRLGGRIDLRADVLGDGSVAADLMLDTVDVQLGDRLFVAPSPARAVLRYEGATTDWQVRIEQFALGDPSRTTPAGPLTARGTIEVQDRGVPQLRLFVGGGLDLSLLRLLPTYIVDADGDARISAKVSGPLAGPEVFGAIAFQSARIVPRGLGTSIELDPGEVLLTTPAIVIPAGAPLRGRIWGGEFSLGGRLGLAGLAIQSASLQAFVTNLAFRIPAELNLTLTAGLTFDAADMDDANTWRLGGDVEILDGLYYKDFDLVTGQLAVGGIGRTVRSFTQPLWQRVEQLGQTSVDLRITGRDRLEINSTVSTVGLDLEFRTDVDVTGTFGAMNVQGEMEALEGSRVTFRGRTFTVQRTNLYFRGARDSAGFPMPYLEAELESSIRPCVRRTRDAFTVGDTSATSPTTISEVLLTARVEGQVPSEITYRLDSTPFYDQRDQLSLILTGCTVDELTAGTAGAPTLDLVLRPVIELVEQNVAEQLNFDEVDLIPTTDGSAGIVIADEVTVRFRWTFDATVGTGSESRQAIRGEFKVFDWLVLEVQEQTSGEEAIRIDTGVRFRVTLD